jgi:pentalenolactone synthase
MGRGAVAAARLRSGRAHQAEEASGVTVQLPFEQAHPLELSPSLRQLQHDGVIHRVRTPVGDEAWLVTGYEEVRSLLGDERLGRSHPDPGNAARLGESVMLGGPRGNYDTEQADHARTRSLLQPHFSAKRMRALQPRVQELATALLDDLARQGPPADLHQALALPLPIQVICELLGVPYADRGQFRSWSEDAGNVRDRARSEHGLRELFDYGRQLAIRKRKQPGDDVISGLCADGLSDDEVATNSMNLLFAGHETTVVAIGMGVLCLLANPAQRRALADDPGLVAPAVEEILRAPGRSGGGIPRYARASLQIGDVTVQPGDLVLLDNRAANHDPAAFPGPEDFDIARDAPPHLAFGHGAHYCIGAPLARIELQAVFSQLPARFPAMRLTVPPGQLPRRSGALTGGLTALPVEW